jgi:hypothetical protein
MVRSSLTRQIFLVAITIVTGISWPSERALGQETPTAEADAWARRALVERFDAVQPQAGESRWMQIEWQTSLWTAREMAAKQGKPIFVWYGSGGSPACHT